MSERKECHMPGPWMFRAHPKSPLDPDSKQQENWPFLIERQGTPGRMDWGILIAKCWGHTTESPEANACLIAAAPELLAALRNLLAEFDSYDAEMAKIGRGHEDYGQQRAEAREAIAKAVGESV